MEITVVKMSYLVHGQFVQLTVKSDGKEFSLWMDGVPVDVFPSAQTAISIGMEAAENHLEPEYNCEVCKDQEPDEGCQACCDHDDTDDHCCLICGKDLTEDRMAAAYDRAKDLMKYGE